MSCEELSNNYRLDGNLAFQRGEYQLAVQHYTKSIEKKETANVYANRAQAQLMINRPAEALLDARSALCLDGKHLKARFRMAKALAALDKSEEALAEFEKCLKMEPNNELIREAISRQKQSAAATPTSSFAKENLVPVAHSSSGSSTPGKGANFSWKQLWMVVDGARGHRITLTDMDGQVTQFRTLDQLGIALKNTTKTGPIALVHLEEYPITGELIRFFASVNSALWQGGLLELFAVKCFANEFIRLFDGKLFMPTAVCIRDRDDLLVNLSTVLTDIPGLRYAKRVVFDSYYWEGHEEVHYMDSGMVIIQLEFPSLVQWLHDQPASGGFTSAAPITNVKNYTKRIKLTKIMAKEDPLEMLANFAVPGCGGKSLQFHENCFEPGDGQSNSKGGGIRMGGSMKDMERDLAQAFKQGMAANVFVFINECKKRFLKATSRLNYSVRVMCKMGCSRPTCMAPCQSEPVRGQSFSNKLGEELRVSVQHVNLDGYTATEFFPPHDLVTIERFHRKD